MKARRCQGCGAPLPASTDGQATLTCTFCGTTKDLATAPAPATVVHVDLSRHASGIRRAVLAFVLVGAAIAVVWVGIIVAASLWTTKVAMEEAGRRLVPLDDRVKPRAMRELAASGAAGWREVRVEPPPGGWSAFDPVKELPWAMAIARQWAPDAALTRIDLSRAAADGTVNLAGGPDDKVSYRFVSPARLDEWGRAADVRADAEATYSLMMQVSEQKVTASLQTGRPSSDVKAPATAPDTLSLADVLARARKNRAFVDRPFYAGYLIHLQSEGWVWYFQTLSGRASIPRVRARDGRPYPYR